MHNLAITPTHDHLPERLHALDIDIGCALRFSRVALQALAVVSDEARKAIDRGLAEEVAMTRIEDMAASEAIAAILTEARRHIASASGDKASTAARDIERLLVEHAADLAGATPGADSGVPLRRAAAGGL